jgi:hypothetical protein
MATDELPSAWLSHRMSGRTRLHVPAMRKQREYFARARERLIRTSGVKRVSTNVRTGSILVEHGPNDPDVAALGPQLGLFRVEPESEPVSLSESARRIEERAEATLRDATGGRVDLSGATSLTYAALGVYQIARGGEIMPAALTMFWSAISLLRKMPE